MKIRRVPPILPRRISTLGRALAKLPSASPRKATSDPPSKPSRPSAGSSPGATPPTDDDAS